MSSLQSELFRRHKETTKQWVFWWGQQVIRLTAKASCKCRRFLFMDATQAAEPAREGTLSRTTG